MAQRSEKRTTKKKSERWVKVCPNCGSKDVTVRGMIGRQAFSNVNYCKSCGFQSPLFPEVRPEEAKSIEYKKPKFNPSQAPILPRTRFPMWWIKLMSVIALSAIIVTYIYILNMALI